MYIITECLLNKAKISTWVLNRFVMFVLLRMILGLFSMLSYIFEVLKFLKFVNKNKIC